ncbi:MMPL family transporter [Allomeiothermus silvanus]|uniref:MMPL family transporter n=1 Tax=Allomeiothermus silvanus TaxID=52022 RepID=UPI00019EA32F|nr:MMPL family transporter [Allomeiothermus silvanus]
MKNSEAQRVTQILSEQFAQPSVDRTVLVSESTLPEKDPRFRRVYDQLIARIEHLEGVVTLHRYDTPSPLRQQSPDGRITATLLETRLEKGEAVIEALRREARAVQTPEVRFYVTGATAVTKDFLHLLEADVKRSELMALPLTGLVLLLAFGALVATGLPLMVGVVAITTGLACLFFLTQFGEVSSFALSVITMLSLGAGIDYALLMVSRFREELSRGLSPRAAAALSTKTAGRAVAFSGLVVAIAMGSMLVPDLTFIRSMGVGGVMSITLTVLASITLLPAMLSLLGERVNSPRWLAFKPISSGKINPFWGRWAGVVMRHPWMWLFLVAGLLLALAWPATQMKLGYTGAFGLAPTVESRKGLELIRQLELGGALDAFEVLLDLGPGGFTAQNRARWRDLEQRLSAWPEVQLVVSPFLAGRLDGQGGFAELVGLTNQYISQNRQYLRLTVIPKDAVRAPSIPDWYSRLKAEARNAGFQNVLLGGAPIGSMEFTKALVGAMPAAIGTVFVATFLLLAVAFRSLVIPLKSILMNTLTVGATYGLITLVFQKGFLAGLIGAPTDVGGIDSSLPILMFAVIFGLSMDYEIFLLSRVQEAHLAGMNTHQAVHHALERSASVITSAALIMIIVFSAFILGRVVANKTIGLGLAVAVFLDATLVRLVLVPAVLVLAGRWNWWLPELLRRVMPRISLES